MAENIFCDARDLFFDQYEPTAPRSKDNGNVTSWTRRFQERRRKRMTASVKTVGLQRQRFKTSRERSFLMPHIRSTRRIGRAKATMFSGILPTRKVKSGRKPCEWDTDSRAPRRRHRKFFYAAEERNKRWHRLRRGECNTQGSSQLKERRRDFNFVLDGGRQQVQKHWRKAAGTGSAPKVRKKGRATNSKMGQLDEMATKLVFKQSDQHQQGGGI